LTNGATINIIEYESSHPGPEEVTANEVIGFIATRVSSGGKIME